MSAFATDFVHASANLNGIKISRQDTRALIERDERPQGFSFDQILAIENQKAAVLHLINRAPILSAANLLAVNTLIVSRLAENSLKTPEILNEFCEKWNAISNPYEQAFFAMYFFPRILPFRTGNIETARIATNFPLVKNSLLPFSFSKIQDDDYDSSDHAHLADAFTRAYTNCATRYAGLVKNSSDGGEITSI